MANTYSKMLQQAKRDQKRRMKQDRIESIKLMKDETERKEKMIFALILEEKIENERLKKKQDKRIQAIKSILDKYARILSYREYLTLRDYLTKDFYQIESDLRKGKIDTKLVLKIRDIVKIESENLFKENEGMAFTNYIK